MQAGLLGDVALKAVLVPTRKARRPDLVDDTINPIIQGLRLYR
jgi:hypothetical protein